MALIACKDCKAEISTDAKNCPNCGAINGAAYKGIRIGGLIYLGLIALAFYWIWGVMTPDKDAKPANDTVVEAPAATQEAPLSPLHFADVPSMIEDFGDYSVETGTFKLISDSPLEIQFAATVAAGDLPENVHRELRRAALYGVYRTFVHTDAGAVKVKAVPNLMTSATARSIQESPSLEVTVTRDQALQAVQSLVPAGSFSDLVLPERAGKIQLDNWTKSFEPLYFKDEGQQALLKAIQAKGGDLVNNG